MSENLTWPEGLNRVRREIVSRRGLWPTVAFRLLVKPRRDQADQLDVLVGNFQPTILDQAGKLDPLLESPMVLDGIMTEFQFSTLLDTWAAGQSFTFGKWSFWPPEIANFTWQEDLTEDVLWDPLLVPLQPHGSRYLVYRLVGYGVPSIPDEVRSAVNREAFRLGSSEGRWSADYLGCAWQPHATDVRIHLPIPVSAEATYDHGGHRLAVNLFYRKPFNASDFWLRFGDRWIIGLNAERFIEDPQEPDGWRRASWSGEGIVRKPTAIWLGTDEKPNQFRWQVAPSIMAEPMTSPQPSHEEWKRWRLQFMNALYDRAGPTTAAYDTYTLAKDLGVPRLEALHVMQYLIDEGLIKPYGPGSQDTALVVLTHEGIREVEQAREAPAAPTKHFPAMNSVTFAGNISNAQIQVGTVQSRQHGQFITIDQTAQVARWAQEVEKRLAEMPFGAEDLADLRAQLETIAAQLKSPKPRYAALATSAEVIKGLLETAATATTVAPQALASIQWLLTNFPHFLGH